MLNKIEVHRVQDPESIIAKKAQSVSWKKWETVKMHSDYIKKDIENNVKYMTREELDTYKVSFKSGCVYLNDSLQANRAGIYVMDECGEFYAAYGGLNHSSFLSGNPVSAAGYFQTDSDGYLKLITNQSGHYIPTNKYTDQAANQLIDLGAADRLYTFDNSWDKEKFIESDMHQSICRIFKSIIQEELPDYKYPLGGVRKPEMKVDLNLKSQAVEYVINLSGYDQCFINSWVNRMTKELNRKIEAVLRDSKFAFEIICCKKDYFSGENFALEVREVNKVLTDKPSA